jgi:type III restriction enzyme
MPRRAHHLAADKQIATRVRDTEPVKVLPDILGFLQKETELTRHTLAEILKRSGRLGEFKINPQAFMAAVAKEISRALHDLMLEGIKVAGAFWEQSRIEQDAEEGIVRYLSNLYEVQNREKSLFDAVVYESEVEKQFARDLDNSEYVKLFVKLPAWFKIDTPIGQYNPDWAFRHRARREALFRPRDEEHAGFGRAPHQRKPEDRVRPEAFRDTWGRF